LLALVTLAHATSGKGSRQRLGRLNQKVDKAKNYGNRDGDVTNKENRHTKELRQCLRIVSDYVETRTGQAV
jgi:hypothetical protein